MAARSYAEMMEKPPARGVISISINANSPLNDTAPPSYGSDRDRAASLMRHIELKLTTGTAMERQTYWRELRIIAQRIDANGPVAQTVRDRVNDSFARALGASGVALTDDQISAAATIALAQRELRRALGATQSIASVDNTVAAITSRSLRYAAGVETEGLPHFESDDANRAANQIAAAIGTIYRDTAQAFDGLSDGNSEYMVIPGENGTPDALAIIDGNNTPTPVSPQKQMDLVNEILRSSLDAQVDVQSSTVNQEFGAVLDQAVAARLAADAYVREAVAGAHDPQIERAHRFEIMAFIDKAARGADEMTASLKATSIEEQTRRFDELSANNEQLANSFVFTTDLAAIAQGVLDSDMFTNYRDAIGELTEQAPPHWERFLRDRILRTESALQRADIVMASRPQALVMEAWVAYAAAAGNTMPSPDEVKAIATSINASFSRPIVELYTEKEVIAPKFRATEKALADLGMNFPAAKYASGDFYVASGKDASRLASLAHAPAANPDLKPGTTEHLHHKARTDLARLLKGKVQVKVRTRERTIRAALRGPMATGLKFDTVAMEGMRFYKATDAIVDQVKALAEANRNVQKHRRASIVATAKQDSKSHDALLDAAKANGFDIINVAVVPTNSRAIVAGREGNHTLSERSVEMKILRQDAEGKEERIDLLSPEGQRLVRGNMILLTPQAPKGQEFSAARAQMIGWQALQSISSKIMVFGNDPQDYNVSQSVRRGVDLGRNVALFDMAGKPADVDAFYPKAVANSPTVIEAARRDVAPKANIPLESNLAHVLITKLAGRGAYSVLAKNAENISDLVALANTTTTEVRDIDSETKAALLETAKAMGPMLATLRDPVKLNAAIDAAENTDKEMQSRKLSLVSSDRLADAYNRPVYVAGNPFWQEEAFKATALIGGRESYGKDTENAISGAVTELARAGQTIITTAEPGVGEMVIRAAAEQNARIVVFAQDNDLSALRMGLQGELREMVENGSAAIVTAQNPGYKMVERDGQKVRLSSPEERRPDILGAATQFADRIILAAANERDMSALIAVEAGQVRPVAVMAPQMNQYDGYSANVSLMRANGSFMAEVARGGTAIVPLAEGDITIDAGKKPGQRQFKDLIETTHLPIMRTASWTQPASVIRSSEQLQTFVESKKSLRVENGKTMTAADLARHYGLVRDPTAAEKRETNAELYVAMSESDQRKLVQESLERMRANSNFRIKDAAGHER